MMYIYSFFVIAVRRRCFCCVIRDNYAMTYSTLHDSKYARALKVLLIQAVRYELVHLIPRCNQVRKELLADWFVNKNQSSPLTVYSIYKYIFIYIFIYISISSKLTILLESNVYPYMLYTSKSQLSNLSALKLKPSG